MKTNNKFSLREFLKKYPTEDVCLDTMFRLKYGKMPCCPKCAVVDAKFYRVKNRRSFECGECGYQIYPMADTVMQNSVIPINLWFYALFLFVNSKNGISACELQRVLGVTYKTAWKMGHRIRKAMGSGVHPPLLGVIEVDETLIGGKAEGKRGWGADNKTCLFGMVERNGKIRVFPVDNRKGETLMPIINENISKGSIINTDENRVYKLLNPEDFKHLFVNHSKRQWAVGDKHTNTIEGYWSHFKKSILGTHTFISRQHLQKYLDEFNFRYNNRNAECVFEELVARI